MLKATAAGQLHRPPRDGDESPLASGRSFIKPLAYGGSDEDPDEFGLQERIPLEFIADSPEQATERAGTLEALLAEHVPGLEYVADSASESSAIGSFEDIDGVGSERADALREAGMTVADLDVMTADDLADVEGVSDSLAADIKAQVGDSEGGE